MLRSLSQSKKPAAQAQRPATQAGVVARFAPPEQLAPHAPQSLSVVRRSISQPLLAVPSQSPKLVLQAMPQVPEVQVGVEFARVEHTVPQPPQFEVLVLVLVSQPSVRLRLQSPKPVAQVQRLPAHPPAELSVPAAGQAAPEHAPQRAAVIVRSKQVL